jgi:hypothetical protein
VVYSLIEQSFMDMRKIMLHKVEIVASLALDRKVIVLGADSKLFPYVGRERQPGTHLFTDIFFK